MILRFNIVKGLENTSIAKDIRIEVFVNEQGFEDEFDKLDEIAWHIEVWDQDQPVAVGRMFESGQNGVFIIGRIAVMKAWRMNNVGKAVMEALEAHARALGAHTLELSAQWDASGFYEKMGYHQHGDVYLDQFCPHIKMIKNI